MATDREFSDGEMVPGTRYRVETQIGSGGMGSVYVVEHVELGKRFVLKALLRELARRKDLVARLRQEWRALARLNHPNIINVTDAGTSANGVPFYVMEFAEGETLAARLQNRRRLPLAESLELGAGVLDGLAAAHEIGIVHRDIKPPNIFVVGMTGVKLLDFGIAKIAHSSAEVITARGVAIGTPRFMSPEQARGELVDGRADLYATGLMLYEMVSGAGPFDDAKDANELLLAHIGKEAPRLSWAAPGVPAEVDEIVARLLAKLPSERPASARQVAEQLRAIARRTPLAISPIAPGRVSSPPAHAVAAPQGDATDASISGVPTNPLPGAAVDRANLPVEATAVDAMSSGTTELATPRIEMPVPASVPSDVTVPGVGIVTSDTLHSPLSAPASVASVASVAAGSRAPVSDFSRTLRIDEYVASSPEVPTRTAVPVPIGGETPPPVESSDPVPRATPARPGVPVWVPLGLTGVVITIAVAVGTWALIGGRGGPAEPAAQVETSERAATPATAPPASEIAPLKNAEPDPAAAAEPAPAAPAPSASIGKDSRKASTAAPAVPAEPSKSGVAAAPRDDAKPPKTSSKPTSTGVSTAASPAPAAPKPKPATKPAPKLTLPGSGL